MIVKATKTASYKITAHLAYEDDDDVDDGWYGRARNVAVTDVNDEAEVRSGPYDTEREAVDGTLRLLRRMGYDVQPVPVAPPGPPRKALPGRRSPP